jgi:hypothetical protein
MGLGAEAFQISAPSISAPSIKDDAVPMVRKADEWELRRPLAALPRLASPTRARQACGRK